MSRRGPKLDLDDLFTRVDRATRSDPREALALVERSMALLPGTGEERARAKARLTRYRAHARRVLNDFAGSLEDYRRAFQLFRRLGDEHEMAVTQIGRIQSLLYRARYRQALEAAGFARRVFSRLGDRVRLARLESNTGNVFHRWDRPEDALRHYDLARATFLSLRDAEALAMVDLNRGNVLAGMGRLDDAETAYRNARRTFASLRRDLMKAEADYGLAYLLSLQGRLTESLSAFEALRPGLTALGERRLLALCEMDSAETYLRLDMWVEAEEKALRGAARFRALDMRYEQARCLAFAGSARLKAGRPARALALWRQAARLFEAEGNRTWRGVIQLSMARLEAGRNRQVRALGLAKEALFQLRRPAPAERRAEAMHLLGKLHADSARTRKAAVAARRLLVRARRAAAGSGASWLVRDAGEALGDLAIKWGTPAAARRHYRAAVQAGERLRTLLHGEDFRAAFFRDRSRPYLALACLDLSDGRPDRAFQWVERGRARALLEGLEDFPRRPAGRKLPVVARELESILRRLGSQYARPAAIPGAGGRPAAGVARLPDVVRRHLESRAESLVGRLYPEYSAAPHPAPAGPRSHRRLPLAAHEALLSFCEMDGSLTAFIQTKEKLSVATDMASSEEIGEIVQRLGYQWGRFRLGPGVISRHGRLLLSDALEDLNLLHGLLVAPLTRAAEKGSWIIVPSRTLAAVPFAALYDGRRFLVEGRSLSLSPSLGVFSRCRQRLDRRCRGTLLVGQSGPETPEVSGELAALARHASRPPVARLSGPRATVEMVAGEARGRAYVHLASHGFFHLERPRLSGIRMADRWLNAHDAARLELTCEMIVLSACHSGTSVIVGGDEWMGLPRAFLKAGAARVMASLWDVDDLATRRLMTRFALEWSRNGRVVPAEALRRAQTSLLAEFRHPYYWAGFEVVGTP